MNHTFDYDLRTVLEHGGSIPDELQRVKDRAAEYPKFGEHFTERLADAVASDATDDEILHLQNLALIEQAATPVDKASIANAIKAAADRAIEAQYADVAVENWDAIAERFNAAADAFTKAHHITPATTDPAALVTASERVRKAWAEGQTQRTTLDVLGNALISAARLAGNHDAAGSAWTIGATVNAEGLHRRRVWEAWEQDSRWTALLELGATIHAPELDELTRYREPAPVEIRQEQRGIGWANVEYDPEDNAAPIPEV